MEKEIHQVLTRYVEIEELVKTFEITEESITFTVDLLDDELSIEFQKTARENSMEYSYDTTSLIEEKKTSQIEGPNLQIALEHLLTNLVNKRDAILEQSDEDTADGLLSPLPDDDLDDISPLVSDSEVFPDVTPTPIVDGPLKLHANVVNWAFGKTVCDVMEDLDLVRITVPLAAIPDSVKELYGQEEDLQITVNFQRDEYWKGEKLPIVKYGKKIPLAEQFINIITRFFEEAWKEEKRKGKELASFEQVSHLSSFLNVPEKVLMEKYQQLLQKKQVEYVKALCLMKTNGILEFDRVMTDLGLEMSGKKEVDHLFFEEGLNNPLLVLYSYVIIRLRGLMEHCIECDKRIELIEKEGHVSDASSVLCTSFKCQFDFIFQEICADLSVRISPTSIRDEVIHNSSLVDLYITLVHAACVSGRRDVIFEPFPEDFLVNKTKDYSKLEKVIDRFPSVEKMKANCGKSELDFKLFLGDERYDLLKWILCFKRNILVQIPWKKKIISLVTDHQYFLFYRDMEKMKKFNKLKKKYGSFYGFHGSSIENWHNILRNNLKIGSGTKLQTTGAAYGNGIYLAPDSQTSLGYSRTGGKIWKNTTFKTQNLRFIKHPAIGSQTPNPYWVIKSEEHIMCRFFMFYTKNERFNIRINRIEKILRMYFDQDKM